MAGGELGLGCGASRIRNLVIVNGNATANSSQCGSGIGAGEADSNGTLMMENLTIVIGNIMASSPLELGLAKGMVLR
jgi:hypothetical protein